LFFRELQHLAADTGPTLLGFLLAVALRFFSGAIALRAASPGLRLRQLNYLSIDANPTLILWFACRCRRFFGIITLPASGAHLSFGQLDYLSADTRPALLIGRFAIPRRFGLRVITLGARHL
jgi:hypothetical protein